MKTNPKGNIYPWCIVNKDGEIVANFERHDIAIQCLSRYMDYYKTKIEIKYIEK